MANRWDENDRERWRDYDRGRFEGRVEVDRERRRPARGFSNEGGEFDVRSEHEGDRGRFSDQGTRWDQPGRGEYRSREDQGENETERGWGQTERGSTFRSQGDFGAERATGHQGGFGSTMGPYETRGGFRSGRSYGMSSGGYGGYASPEYISSFGGGMAAGFGTPPGRHAGKGPKGYRRSDERIREEISDRLTEHPDVDASEIEVRVESGEVTLTGTIESRHAKRLAEDIAENVQGVRDVHNQIRVQTAQEQTAGSQNLEPSTATSTSVPSSSKR